MADFEQIWTDKQRKTKISRELKRLQKIYENIETSRKKTVEKLINDAAFMAVTLEEIRLVIQRDGVIETYQNGENQKGIKKSSAVEVYDKMVNTYSKVIKQMCDLLPEKVVWDEPEEEDPAEELLKFTNGFEK